MKRTFLKFLPIVAAVLLATSCSKDNDGDNSVVDNPVETQNIASPTESSPAESNAVPFSIKVTGGGSLSKVAYKDEGSTVTIKFDATSDAGREMTVSGGGKSTTLTLASVDEKGDATFTGGWTDGEPTDGTELTATIKYNESSTTTTSTTSITDLMESCAHTYSGEFKYKTDNMVSLTDNNAYIEIIMSPLQKDIDLKIDGTPQNFAMANGKVWIAVADGTTFTSNFTAKKTCTAGRITTINRAGFVDLGIEGILWADRNLGADEVYDYGNYYAWGEVEPKTDYSWATYTRHGNGSDYDVSKKYNTTDGKTTLEPADDAAAVTNPKWNMPTQSDFAALKSNCYWVWVTDYNSKSGYIVYKTKDDAHKGGVKYAEGENSSSVDYTSSYSVADATHIFLPAAGFRLGTDLRYKDSRGGYWSSSLYTDDPQYGRNLSSNSGSVGTDNWGSRHIGQSVRPVRCK